MTDVYPIEKRSWIMSRVKRRDTQPEVLARSLVHRMGFRFRIHRRELPGNPDIVLPRHKKLIFIHGCFWHGHTGCSRSKRPTTNKNFWNNKLNSNIKRDRKNYKELQRIGWKVLVVWGCETKSSELLLRKLERFLYDE